MYIGPQTSLFIPCDDVHYYFRITARGYDGTDSAAGDWTTEANSPSAPTGITVHNGTDAIFLVVDLATDVSHTEDGFRHWEVERADDDVGTNAVTIETWTPEPGAAVDTSLMVPQVFDELYYYRMRTVSWSGKVSSYTTYLPAVSRSSAKGPINDRFDGYTRPDTSGLAGLYGLPIEGFEVLSDWQSTGGVFTLSLDSTVGHYVEGAAGLKIYALTPDSDGIFKNVSLDLSQEQRFTDDDFMTIAVYTPNASRVRGMAVQFCTTANDLYSFPFDILSNGMSLVKLKKSEVQEFGSPDWSNITRITIGTTLLSEGYVVVDGLRIAKADPDNPDTYNETGETWDFSPEPGDGAEWHVIHGDRDGEPAGVDDSLAQFLEEASPTNWQFAIHTKSNVDYGLGVVGTFLKGIDGEVAFAFNVWDASAASRTMYTVELNTITNHVRLARWKDGVRTQLGEADYSATHDEEIWLGANWIEEDGTIQVYASSSESNVIQGSNKLLTVIDETPLDRGGSVGVGTKGCNARFFRIRAGSPEHAHSADWAAWAENAKEALHATTADALTSSPFFPGLIVESAAASPPDGWLLCDGQAVSRETYADLFAAIGTTWGSGDGSTTFNVPDLRDLFIQGASATDALGATGGNKYMQGVYTHNHVEKAAGASSELWYAGGSTPARPRMSISNTTNSDQPTVTADTGSTTVDQRPPFAALHRFIKT
jgi:microcystin-dependent protein